MNKHFYLKHEIMSFNDPRIQNMISREGGKAYGTYWYIMEKLSFLPDMEADMKYLKPFATRNFTYPYMMKIVTDFQLFTIVGDHFSPVQLNTKYVEEPQKKEEDVEVKPAKNTAKNSGQNGKKYPDNDVKSGKNDGFSTKNRQTMDKNRDGNESGINCNSQNNSGLSDSSIQHKENIEEKLYIEVCCEAGDDKTTAVIAGGHTTFIYIERNGEVQFQKQHTASCEKEEECLELTLRKVYDFALNTPLDEISFILETARLNKAAAERSFEGNYGHGLGKMLRGTYEHKVMGDSVFSHILSYTSGACDARMAGAMIPVMSNSGSGNQGISATLPVLVFAEENDKSEEELIRALMLSHLTVIYIKQSLGRLSALCGCVVAATGSSCGITWLMGGTYDQVSYAVQNMIANLTGMICDGAKPSCALKVTTGVSTAVLSAIMAMENRCVTSVEGIIDEDVDQSIRNLTKIGSKGMNETDKLVLEIMTGK